jgi:hypothetical protein
LRAAILRGAHNLASRERFRYRFLRPVGEPADRGTVDHLAPLEREGFGKVRHAGGHLIPRARNPHFLRVIAEEMRAAEVEADQNEAAGPVFGERKPDRLAAAVTYFSAVDDTAPARESGALDGLDPSEVKVPTRFAVLAPSVGFAVRFGDGFLVVVPPAPVRGIDGGAVAPEPVSIADREDGPTGERGEVEAAGGLAAGKDDGGAPRVSEVDEPPPFVSNSGPVSSPSRISTDRFFASSKASSRGTLKVFPRF